MHFLAKYVVVLSPLCFFYDLSVAFFIRLDKDDLMLFKIVFNEHLFPTKLLLLLVLVYNLPPSL